jgi:hypothetical protein
VANFVMREMSEGVNMRNKVRVVNLVVLIATGGLLTAGTASAAPASAPFRGPACGPNVISRDVPASWIPRSPWERDRRFRWDQVRKWDGNHDNRLSDQEIAAFHRAGERIPGGPNCSRPERPRA